MPYTCPKCSKIFKNNGKWLQKHMIEKCHVMSVKPIELVEKEDIGLHEILRRITNLESMIKKGNVTTKYRDNPIERIKKEESEKINDPLLKQYRSAFSECISELKEVLAARKLLIEEELLDSVIR